MKFLPIINERIKQMRLQRGFTLLELAELLNVKEATMQRYESGEIKNIKHETISSLSKIFDCPPGYLMGWNDHPTKDPTLTKSEQTLIEKYRALDERGKLTIDSALENQYKLTKTPKH